jgi:CheY-like chemotaxis protein
MKMLKDITVLVAEDERPVRMLLRVVLESAGASVIEADNGATAVRLLDLHPNVDVLLTDVNMPMLDGAALARHARAARPSLPIVACSALDLEEARPGMLAHVDAVVRKPFVPSELIRAIAMALARGDDPALAAS